MVAMPDGTLAPPVWVSGRIDASGLAPSPGVFVHFLLTYDLAHDYLERRGEFRDAHLALAWEAQERGELILAGAMAEPADKAVLVFDCETAELVQLFAARDPYVLNGLVRAFHVRQWNTVVGDLATNPVRPG